MLCATLFIMNGNTFAKISIIFNTTKFLWIFLAIFNEKRIWLYLQILHFILFLIKHYLFISSVCSTLGYSWEVLRDRRLLRSRIGGDEAQDRRVRNKGALRSCRTECVGSCLIYFLRIL